MDAPPELDRIRAAYVARDATPVAPVPAGDPALQLHLQELEWQLARALREAGRPLAGADVLDLGTGGGAILARLKALGAARAAGVDLVEHRIELGRVAHPGLELLCASATDLPFEDGTFDVVTQVTCMSSILDDEVRQAVAMEALRVLRPGGVVVSYDVRTAPRLLSAVRRGLGPAADARTTIRPLDLPDLRALWGAPLAARTVQLNLDVARLLGGRRPLTQALAAVPPLRSHLLATFRKP